MQTPQASYPALAKALGLDCELYVKREDLHPYGSHKGRSIPLMIREYATQGIRNFVISSSGNAALAAMHAVQEHNKKHMKNPLTLQIFVGRNIPEEKLYLLKEQGCIVIKQTDEPKKEAFQMDKAGNAKNLRQSTDDLALAGYAELAQELNEIQNLQAIFIPTSSGTTAQALGEACATRNQHPQIHIVQTTACHPIAEFFQAPLSLRRGVGVRSIANAIVDNVAHRKQHVIATIENSGGAGWIVTDKEITDAMDLVRETCGFDISANGALGVASLKKAMQHGWTWRGAVVCLVTGR